MKVTSKGQVTIPLEIREKLGLLPNSEVEFELKNGAVLLRKSRAARSGVRQRGKHLIASMKGAADVKMTTDEILALTRK